MTTTELANAIGEACDDNELIDTACIKRLMDLADDYGAQGSEARHLLIVIARMLHIAIK